MKRYRSDEFKANVIRDAAERAARDEAAKIVDRWNAQLAERRTPQFSPTIGAAFQAGKPWLCIHCPGCRQVYEVDLRKIVRPPDFPIMALRAAMVCESMCRGAATRPDLIELAALPYDARKLTSLDRA